jgi:hypothetical protein
MQFKDFSSHQAQVNRATKQTNISENATSKLLIPFLLPIFAKMPFKNRLPLLLNSVFCPGGRGHVLKCSSGLKRFFSDGMPVFLRFEKSSNEHFLQQNVKVKANSSSKLHHSSQKHHAVPLQPFKV